MLVKKMMVLLQLRCMISNTCSSLKDKIIKITKTKNENIKNEDNNKSEFDKSVDEFIKNNSN